MSSAQDYDRGSFRNLRWNGFVYADWSALPVGDNKNGSARSRVSSKMVTEWMVNTLRTEMRSLQRHRLRNTIVATHFVPSREIIRYSSDPYNDFAIAFLGSELLGGRIEEFSEITLWLCGHVHRKIDAHVGGVRILSSPAGYIHFIERSLKEIAADCLTVIDI